MSTSYASGAGRVMFAAIIMFAIGFARIISAITYLGNSHDVANLAGRLFGADRHLRLATSPSGSEA